MTDIRLDFKADTSQLKTAQTELDGVAASGKKVNEQMQGTQKKVGAVGKGFDAIKKNATGLSFQLQDVAVQAQMGTNNLTILAQQGPQIASLFGPIGAITGTVIGLGAALAGPLLAGFTAAGDEADDLSKRISELSKELNGLSDEVADITLFNLINQMMELPDAISEAESKVKDLQNALDLDIQQGTLMSDEAWKERTKAIQDQQLEVDLLKTKLDRANTQSTQVVKQLNREASERDKVSTAIRNQANASENLLARLKQQNDTFGMSRAEIIRYNAALAAAEAPTQDLALAITAEAEALAEKTEQMQIARETQQEMDKAATESVRAAEESAREYERTFNTLSDNITDAIMDVRSLGDVATAVAEQIKRAFVQNAIVNPLLGSFGMPTPAGSLMSGGFSPSSLFNMGGGNTSFFTNTLSGLGDFLAFGSAGTAATGSLSAGAGGSHALDFAGAGPSGLGSGSGLGLQGGLAGAATAAAFAIPAVMSIAQLFSGGTPRLTFGQGSEDFRQSTETAFGRFGVVGGGDFTKDVSDATIQGFLDVVETIDESIASVLRPSVVSNVGETLESMERFLGTWDQFLGEGESITRQYTTGVLGRTGADPADQLIMRYEHVLGEALPKVFSDQLLENTDDIEQFVGSTVAAMSTLHESQNIFVDDLQELAGAYEKWSTEGESFTDFFGRVNAAAIADLQEFALAMQNTFAGIESLAGLSLSIREQLLSDEQLYDRLRQQADAIGESINTLSSPEAIQQAIAEYQSLSGRAFGLLSEEQQQLFGAGIADSIDSVVMAATERANTLIDEQENNRSIEEFATSTQEMANTAANFGSFVEQFGDFVQQATQAAQGMLNASATLRQAAQESSAQTNNIWTGRV